MPDTKLEKMVRNERYPRASGYPARWMLDGNMGPNPLWLAESLSSVMTLEPGMRVLDMGCGAALSSIFLAKEFGVEVWATDLWVKASENWQRITEAGLAGRVHPIFAEAHALPFADGFFDALVSYDAYQYFGTDDLYLGYYSRFVQPGGRIGMVVPGLAVEPTSLPPAHLVDHWEWDFCAWHSPDWWRHHWEKTGLVDVDVCDRLPDGWSDWSRWNEACDVDRGEEHATAALLRADAGRLLGFTRVVARRH
jgi:SAM-dependent methyltransferase